MNYFKTALLLAVLTGFVLVIGYLLGGHTGLMLALVAALGMNLFAYWNSDKMVLRMSNAQEVGPETAPELFGIVQQVVHHAFNRFRLVILVIIVACKDLEVFYADYGLVAEQGVESEEERGN